MRVRWVLFVVVAACGYPPLPFVGDAGSLEAGRMDAQACVGSVPATTVCFTILPTAPMTLPTDLVIIDTDSTTVCDQDNDRKADLCVMAGAGFTVGTTQTLRGFGSKPLVLVSTATIDVQGTVDVSSTKNGGATSIGAAANPAACAGTPATGASGAFGGSFGGKGGTGEAIASGTGGVPAPAMTDFPTTIRGGCAGGDGGSSGGVGGAGGGAVLRLAGQSITVSGKINASGAGGRGGGETTCGGGGGGSGGMIILDAPQVSGTGQVFANGGGGGQGGTPGVGKGGDDGKESISATDAAKGGQNPAGVVDGGHGDNGSVATVFSGGSSSGQSRNQGGGGAGGGGAGFVHAPGIASVAPPSKDLR